MFELSYNATYLAADSSHIPSEDVLEKVLVYLNSKGYIGAALSKGLPTFGEEFSWKPGPNCFRAVEGDGYVPPTWDFARVSMYIGASPTPVWDDSGPAFETRFYIQFVEGYPKDEFVQALQELTGTELMTWTGHY